MFINFQKSTIKLILKLADPVSFELKKKTDYPNNYKTI